MNKKLLASMLGAAAMAGSAAALAQQPAVPAWYIGGDIGRTDFGSDDDTGFKIFGGYQIHRNFAVEAGYGLLYDKSGSEVTALEAVAVGIFPLANQFSLYGKLGLANVDVKTPAGSDDGTELTYGLGVQYDFTPKLGLRGQWQQYDTDEKVDVLSVGVVYRF